MNVGSTVGSVLTQTVNQADAAKQQLGTQSLPHLAFVEKQTQQHVMEILENVMPKEKPEPTVDKDKNPKEKRTLRYTVKGKKITAIIEPHIDTTV
jgi:hypothetical protein